MVSQRRARIGIFFALLTAWPSTGHPAHAQDKAVTEEITRLLIERRDTLQWMSDILEEGFYNGKHGVPQLLEIRRDIFKVNLELCAGAEERIAELQRELKLVQRIMKRAEELSGLGLPEVKVTKFDVAQAKSAWLALRIELLSEQAKLKPAKAE